MKKNGRKTTIQGHMKHPERMEDDRIILLGEPLRPPAEPPSREGLAQYTQELLDSVFKAVQPHLRPGMVQGVKNWLVETARDADFVFHGGQLLEATTGGTAASVYLEDRQATAPGRRGEVDYAFELRGAHEGPPARVWMINPHMGNDESGPEPVFDRLVWMDTEESLPDFLEDAYTDELRDHLRTIASESWN